MFTFYTEIIKQDVVDRHGRWLGRPCDFVIKFDEAYPRFTALVVATGIISRRYYIIPWQSLHHTNGSFQLKVSFETLKAEKSYSSQSEITLKKNILDQQVVDTFNRKVVRVNDVHLLQVDNDLRVAHVDVGPRGLVRRLGWQGMIDKIVRLFSKHSHYLTSEKFIPWKYVQPLSILPTTGKIQLNVAHKELKSIPPADVSEMLMELDTYQRAALFKTLDPQSQIDILTELELKWQVDLIDELDPHTASDLLERMPADEATDLLGSMPRRDAERFLGLLSIKKSRQITELLKHEAHSAGGLMTKEFITLGGNMLVSEALERICKTELKKAETIHSGYVADEDSKLIGMVSLRQLMLESHDAKVSDVMLKKPPAVNIKDDIREISETLSKYNLFAVPVVNDENVLEGIITVDDILAVIIKEEWGEA